MGNCMGAFVYALCVVLTTLLLSLLIYLLVITVSTAIASLHILDDF